MRGLCNLKNSEGMKARKTARGGMKKVEIVELEEERACCVKDSVDPKRALQCFGVRWGLLNRFVQIFRTSQEMLLEVLLETM